MKTRACLLALGLIAGMTLPAAAQEGLRDPTLTPTAARPAAAPASGAEPTGSSSQPQHIMVLNGRPYLIVAGRRLGVGDTWGEARIERIADGAFWLKEGGVSRRVSLYPGIDKRPAAADGAASKAPPRARPVVRTKAQTDMATLKNNKEQP